jgi:hypothetical protein
MNHEKQEVSGPIGRVAVGISDVQYFGTLFQHLINLGTSVSNSQSWLCNFHAQYCKFRNVSGNIYDKLGNCALKSDLKLTISCLHRSWCYSSAIYFLPIMSQHVAHALTANGHTLPYEIREFVMACRGGRVMLVNIATP